MIYAQEATGTGTPLDFLDFINLGVLAVLVVGFTKGWVVPGYVLEKETLEKEARQEELTELRTRLDQEVLPQLWRTTDLLARFAAMDDGKGMNQSEES